MIRRSINCSLPAIVETDPNQSYAYARRYVRKPELININPTLVNVTYSKKLGIGRHTIQFGVNSLKPYLSCGMLLIVVGKYLELITTR